MKPILFSVFVIAILMILSNLVIAQPGLPTTPTQAPIDGGLGILAAAGGAYALKKLRDRKRSNDLD